ncbi:MAG: glucose-1-phosphate adenylyltransferase [Acidimicrobiia bacterium]|nr:glucose-1-phosphate adenylyltransferase [Acidimicrobiia bacterium]
MAPRRHVLAMVLAGGEGKRLFPLTRDRAKPAVPFGGQYRLIDFVLSNLVNGGFRRIVVLTQYKSHSLDTHLAQTWRLSPILGYYVAPVPAQMRRGPHWFSGSADAIFQNLNLIGDEEPDYVIVFGADHIYRMDPSQMLDRHIESGAAATVAGIQVPIGDSSDFGIIDAGADGKIRSFLEKPAQPPSMPGNPDFAFASMGNYIFTTEALREAVIADSLDEDSRHDMGGSIVPMFVEQGGARVYDFNDNAVPGQTEQEFGYWRDVGTLDAYFQASMDLVTVDPIFDLYNEEWPILTSSFPYPPAKFVHDHEGRRGFAVESLVSAGAIVSGASVRRSIISPEVRLHSYASVEDSVLFDGVHIGRNAVVRRAIIDKGVVVPPGFQIGVDLDLDRERYTVSDDGIIVIGKGDKLA